MWTFSIAIKKHLSKFISTYFNTHSNTQTRMWNAQTWAVNIQSLTLRKQFVSDWWWRWRWRRWRCWWSWPIYYALASVTCNHLNNGQFCAHNKWPTTLAFTQWVPVIHGYEWWYMLCSCYFGLLSRAVHTFAHLHTTFGTASTLIHRVILVIRPFFLGGWEQRTRLVWDNLMTLYSGTYE